MSGRWRYALALVIGFMIAGGLIFAAKWEADRQGQLRMDSFRVELADLARISETIIANRFRQYDDVLLVLREEFVADPKRFPQSVQFFRSGALADHELLVVLVDREGYLTYTDAPDVPARLYLGYRPYFRFFADGGKDRFYIDEPIFGRVTRRYSLPLVRPIYDKQGGFLGVVAISVTQESLPHFGHRLQLSSNTAITVVNKGGSVVTRSRNLAKVQGTRISPELLAPMLIGSDGLFSSHFTFNGVESTVAYRHIPGLPLIIYVTSPSSEVLHAISVQSNVLLLGSIFTSLIILALIVVNLQRRKITEKFITTQRAHLKEAQRIAGMGSWELDLKTLNFQWSDEVYRLFGVSREHFKPDLENFLSLVPETGRAAVRASIEQAAVEGSYYMEHFVLRGDGELREMVERGETLRSAAGKAAALIGTVQDITERKQAEEVLRESEARYRELVENAVLGIFRTTQEGKFIMANQRMAEIFGYDSQQHFLADVDNIIELYANPEERSIVLKEIDEKGHIGGKEGNFKRMDGSPIYCNAYVRSIQRKDGETIYEGLLEDITEQKSLEDQLHRAQKMEAMGLMAGGIAHDLNNILSGIVSYPELLLMDLPEDSPLRNPIKTIQESGMRAVDVVEDLMTIAKGAASSKEVLDLNNTVKEYMDSAEHKHLESTHSFITFKTQLDSDLLNLNASRSHIKKALMNLALNASEAIEGVGTVTISTANRYLDEPLKGYEDVRTGEYAVLIVSDDGSGILPQDLERIFEPFYTKRVMGRVGTGLGLAVVWNSMQDHNGYINVKSSEKGTIFELYFPVTREEVAGAEAEVPLEDYLGHGEKILVVDDEERQRMIASGILTRLGYNSEVVSSGEAAIEYVKENPVDLIVLDMVMPKGINGRKTYEEIIKIRPGQKAIIASGFAKTKEVDMAQELGAGKYIKKPYTLSKVGVAVKEELEK